MRSFASIGLQLTVAALAVIAAAGSAPGATLRQDGICNTPPCTRQELERYEIKLIKRLQQANRLSSEARARGEIENADRLKRVFRRNFDRRQVVVEVIRSTPPD